MQRTKLLLFVLLFGTIAGCGGGGGGTSTQLPPAGPMDASDPIHREMMASPDFKPGAGTSGESELEQRQPVDQGF